ncbi:MAG TPA: SH3 domain-containing protein, partial [Rhizomicrobium sp.]|nr:SH3 domain-containing protein [Rhizomicrobium sp.]
ELDDLSYFPPGDEEHSLAIRLVAKDDSGATTLALIELAVTAGQAQARVENPAPEAPPGDRLRQEISSLKNALAGRERELGQVRASSEQMDADWQHRLDAAVAAARNDWSSAESSRLAALKLGQEKEAAALRELKENIAAANTLLANRERELAALKSELTEQRRTSEAEISAAKQSLEAQKARDAERREQSAKTLAALKLRCDDTEARLKEQRQKSNIEILAARDALQAQGALDTDKQARAAETLAELKARCDAAEAEIDRQREALEAEILSTRKVASDQDDADRDREEQAAQALEELKARCEKAEAALRQANAAGEKAAADDVYVRDLNQQIKTLQAILVDREAAVARAEASLEQMQTGVVAKPAPAHWEPLPGTLRQAGDETKKKKPDSHLMRDFLLVFGLVAAASLVFFVGLPSLPTNWQLPNLGGLFKSNDDDPDASASPLPAPSAPPKPALPPSVVLRDVNLRAQPSMSAAVIAGLKHDTAVTILDRQGNWDHVEVVISGQISRQGWVYGSYVGERAKSPP